MTPLPASEWKPGIEGEFYGLPEKVYRSAPGVNISSLKKMRISPAHYKAAMEDTETDRTGALAIGTLVHSLTLDETPRPYVVRPAQFDSWRTKAAQEWRDAQTVDVLTPEEEKVILKCAEALKSEPIIVNMAQCGWSELSCFRRHARTGLLIKCRGDLVAYDSDGDKHGADIKTVPEYGAEREAFSRSISDRDYHLQAAFYSDMFNLRSFILVAVEKGAHAGVAPYYLENDDMELGRRTYNALLQRLRECMDRDEWPSYPKGIRKIGLTQWKRKQEMEDVE